MYTELQTPLTCKVVPTWSARTGQRGSRLAARPLWLCSQQCDTRPPSVQNTQQTRPEMPRAPRAPWLSLPSEAGLVPALFTPPSRPRCQQTRGRASCSWAHVWAHMRPRGSGCSSGPWHPLHVPASRQCRRRQGAHRGLLQPPGPWTRPADTLQQSERAGPSPARPSPGPRPLSETCSVGWVLWHP